MNLFSLTGATGAKLYEGTKTLKAWPLTRGDYNAYRGWEMPHDEDATEPGYLVEYEPDGKANHVSHEGYISWSPADVFERSYHEIDAPSDKVLDHPDGVQLMAQGGGSAASPGTDQAEREYRDRWQANDNRRMALEIASRGREGHSATDVVAHATAYLAFLNGN